ncbi:MAG: dipeptide ABC transporter ATP-binding protein [Anaerolineae bacterium]
MNVHPVLTVDHLAIAYRTRKGYIQAVRDVSFDILPGETLGLVGESGCGKSTVAYSLVGFLGRNGRITNGRIIFKGQDIQLLDEETLRKLRGAHIAMVYQEPMSALNPTMRIGRQLAEALAAHTDLPAEEIRRRCITALQDVYMPDPESILSRYPHQLSGGQQQRVCIAMAMLNQPELLIMDEPTTALDVTVEAAVLDLVAELKSKFRTATLYISHNLGVIARVADKVGVMYAGELVELASTTAIYQHPLHPYTVGLMRCLPDVDAPRGTRELQPIPGRVPSPDEVPAGCIFAPRCEYATPECTAERPSFEEIAPGHFARCWRAREWLEHPLHIMQPDFSRTYLCDKPAGEEPILKVEGLKTYYPMPFTSVRSLIGLEKRRYVRAVDGVSLSVDCGYTLGIVGESGCGKSSLARTIVGLEAPTGGKMEFLGIDISEEPVERRRREVIRHLQMVFQNPDGTLNPSYTVGDQIAMSLKRFRVVPADEVYGRVVQLLEAVKLNETYYYRLPRQLSGGEKQRVGIARAIASNPKMVICDEPVSALDVSVQAAVLSLLLEIQQQYQTAMILISHDLSSVRFFSDYVAVMYLGKLVEYGSVEEIFSPPSHPYTAALLAAVPRPDPTLEQTFIRLAGEIPSPVNPPAGCRFHTRCPYKLGEICEREEPPARFVSPEHIIYCHLPADTLYAIHPVICRRAS